MPPDVAMLMASFHKVGGSVETSASFQFNPAWPLPPSPATDARPIEIDSMAVSKRKRLNTEADYYEIRCAPETCQWDPVHCSSGCSSSRVSDGIYLRIGNLEHEQSGIVMQLFKRTESGLSLGFNITVTETSAAHLTSGPQGLWEKYCIWCCATSCSRRTLTGLTGSASN